jgi:hypothetical protein
MSSSGDVTLADVDYLQIIIHDTTAFELLRTALEFDLFERLNGPVP